MCLEAIGDSIWLADGGLVSFYGFPYPTRSAVVRLPEGGLWVWSPVKLTRDLSAAIARIGTPKHLVSPNKLHHLYLQDWKAAYPSANLWGPPSLIEKRQDLKFREPLGDLPPAEWQDAIDQAWFRGSRFLDEVVFFHRPSATAILADLSQNFSEKFLNERWSWWQRPLARAGGIASGYAPLDWRLSFTSRGPARRALHKMLGWTPKQAVIAHGGWQRDNACAYLMHAFRWLEK